MLAREGGGLGPTFACLRCSVISRHHVHVSCGEVAVPPYCRMVSSATQTSGEVLSVVAKALPVVYGVTL
jgi:hypothetical protein